MGATGKTPQDYVNDEIARFVSTVAHGLKRAVMPDKQLSHHEKRFLRATYWGIEDHIKAAQETIFGIAKEKRFDPAAMVLLSSEWLGYAANLPRIWAQEKLPTDSADTDAIERIGGKVVTGVLNLIKSQPDAILIENLTRIHADYHLKSVLREPAKRAPAAPLPYNLREMKRASRALTQEAHQNALAWPHAKTRRIQRQTQNYFLFLGIELSQHEKGGELAPGGLLGHGETFFEKHPNAVEHFNRLALAIEGMIQEPEIRGWARTTRVDLDDPETARKLFGHFADRLDQILWDPNFYPKGAMKQAMKSPLERQAFEATLVNNLIERLEADKKFVFSCMFPRNRRNVAAMPKPA